MSTLNRKIGTLAVKVIEAAMASGLTWDESVAALGVASKVLADSAAREGDGDQINCHAYAQKRFSEGFAQHSEIVFATSDLSSLASATPEQVQAVLSNANTKIFLRH